MDIAILQVRSHVIAIQPHKHDEILSLRIRNHGPKARSYMTTVHKVQIIQTVG